MINSKPLLSQSEQNDFWRNKTNGVIRYDLTTIKKTEINDILSSSTNDSRFNELSEVLNQNYLNTLSHHDSIPSPPFSPPDIRSPPPSPDQSCLNHLARNPESENLPTITSHQPESTSTEPTTSNSFNLEASTSTSKKVSPEITFDLEFDW